MDSIYETKTEEVENTLLAKKCLLEWERQPSLHAEFGDRFETYYHFKCAEFRGAVKIQSNTTLRGQ